MMLGLALLACRYAANGSVNALPIEFGIEVNRLGLLLLGIGTLWHFRLPPVDRWTIPMFLFLGWLLLCASSNGTPHAYLRQTVSGIIQAIAIIMVCRNGRGTRFIALLVAVITITAVFAGTGIFTYEWTHGGIIDRLGFRLGRDLAIAAGDPSLGPELINPNEIAMPLTLAAIACLTLIGPAFGRQSRWLARIGAGAAITALILTGSRGMGLAAVVGVLGLAVARNRAPVLAVAATGVGILTLATLSGSGGWLAPMLNRLGEGDSTFATVGDRSDIWMRVLESCKDALFMGPGIAATPDGDVSISPHSGYLASLEVSGLTGACLFLLLMLQPMAAALLRRGVGCALMVTLATIALTMDVLPKPLFWISYALVIVSLSRSVAEQRPSTTIRRSRRNTDIGAGDERSGRQDAARASRVSILLVGGSLHGGGAERQLAHLASGLGGFGHAVRVATLQADADRTDFEVICLWSGRRRSRWGTILGLAGAAVRLFRCCLIRRPDVIVGWLAIPTILAAIVARLLGIPFVASIRNATPERIAGLPTGMQSWLLRSALSSAKLVIANSAAGIREYRTIGLLRSPRTQVIPNIVDTLAFRPGTPEEILAARRVIGCPDHGPVMLYVGRIAPEKDIPLLLEVVRTCRERRGDVTWVIVGAGRAALTRMAMDRGLDLTSLGIVLIERSEDMPTIYRACDALCLTSRFEGSPNSVLEARQTGLAVVTTDCGNVRALVGSRDRIVRPDPSDFVRAIDEVLAQPAATHSAARMSSNHDAPADLWSRALSSVA